MDLDTWYSILQHFTKGALQFTFAWRMYEWAHCVNQGLWIANPKNLLTLQRFSEYVLEAPQPWRIHHTMHQFQKILLWSRRHHCSPPAESVYWLMIETLLSSSCTPLLSLPSESKFCENESCQVVFWARQTLPRHFLPSWIDEYMNTRFLFYIKFLIGCICEFYVYILVAKEAWENRFCIFP